jgi:hypothetical protein
VEKHLASMTRTLPRSKRRTSLQNPHCWDTGRCS